MTSFDEASMTSGYARYLAAKTTVDDRALNRHVLAELRRLMPAGAPRVLEVGAGLGTMAQSGAPSSPVSFEKPS